MTVDGHWLCGIRPPKLTHDIAAPMRGHPADRSPPNPLLSALPLPRPSLIRQRVPALRGGDDAPAGGGFRNAGVLVSCVGGSCQGCGGRGVIT